MPLASDTVMATQRGWPWTLDNQSFSTLPTNAANGAALPLPACLLVGCIAMAV